MKIDFGSRRGRRSEARIRRRQWTPWFAWFPVEVAQGVWVWLEVVERRWWPDAIFGVGCWHYQEVTPG